MTALFHYSHFPLHLQKGTILGGSLHDIRIHLFSFGVVFWPGPTTLGENIAVSLLMLLHHQILRIPVQALALKA